MGDPYALPLLHLQPYNGIFLPRLWDTGREVVGYCHHPQLFPQVHFTEKLAPRTSGHRMAIKWYPGGPAQKDEQDCLDS